MVRRFGKMMSFSGRLSGGGSSNDHQGDNSVVPISMSSNFEDDRLSLPIHNQVLISRTIQDGQKEILVDDLIECKSRILDQSRAMKKLKAAHEVQLVALSRQLLELECGLRKRERELCAVLQQRDRVIREQAHVIRFLTKKTGTKRSDILTLADEAVAKIPQWSDVAGEEEEVAEEKEKKVPKFESGSNLITKAKSEITLTSILESESENDSAVILDELASPTSTASKSVSRSVSDVMSSEPELVINAGDKNSPISGSGGSNYRGFLLRHGSYERYKIRSRMQHLQQNHHQHSHCDQHHHGQQQQHGGHSHHREAAEYAQIAANATLPRNKKNRNKKDSATISGHSHGGEVVQEKTPYAVSQSLGKELSASSLPSSNCSSPSTTVIIINGSSNEATTTSTSTSNKPNSNHRSVTKPRDVKNKSNRTKMILRMNTSSSSLLSTSSSSSPPNSKSPSPPIVITDKLIQQSGSVYCSLFGGDLSEEDIQNHHKKQIHHSSYA